MNRSVSVLASLALLASSWSSVADALASPSAVATKAAGGCVDDTAARKRTGRKSFLQKQSRNKLPPTLTQDELHDLGSSLSNRKRGSHSFQKGWKNYRTNALNSIRDQLSENLPHPANKAGFENLFFRLGVASDRGQMPSFADAGARSGYAVEFFCRARTLADLYMDASNPSCVFPEFWSDGMMQTAMLGGCGPIDGENAPYSIVSLGGGPGFDFVSAAVAAAFSWYTSENAVSPSVQCTVLDYEEGWEDLVVAMNSATQQTLGSSNAVCDWGGKCDITKSIFDPCNQACLELVPSTQLWTCQYTVAENAELLRESEYIFFRELFDHAKPGTMWVLSEVHPRLWPEFYSMMVKHCPSMQLTFHRSGRQMLLRKGTGAEQKCSVSDEDRLLLEQFEKMGESHLRKIDSGWQRQVPKMRGS